MCITASQTFSGVALAGVVAVTDVNGFSDPVAGLIDFEDLSPGTQVTNQYDAALGVTFSEDFGPPIDPTADNPVQGAFVSTLVPALFPPQGEPSRPNNTQTLFNRDPSVQPNTPDAGVPPVAFDIRFNNSVTGAGAFAVTPFDDFKVFIEIYRLTALGYVVIDPSPELTEPSTEVEFAPSQFGAANTVPMQMAKFVGVESTTPFDRIVIRSEDQVATNSRGLEAPFLLIDDFTFARPIPEPGTLVLLSMGVVMGLSRRRFCEH